MKVYLVTYSGWTQPLVFEKVFDTRQKAEAWILKCDDNMEPISPDGDTYGKEDAPYSTYKIMEFDVE